MVMSYFLAQLMPWATDGDQTTPPAACSSSARRTSTRRLRGYYTKYDCSAADINPIGGVNKRDLKAFLMWARSNARVADLAIPVLKRVAEAQPSAELTGAEGAQSTRSTWACHTTSSATSARYERSSTAGRSLSF